MGILSDWNWALDGWIVAAGVLCAIASSLLGNFLVLRRMSMLGDAISHAVLPGLAAAFLISGSRNSIPMFLGAVVVGVLTAMFTEWIRGVGRVDEGASMGVVFTSLFALGLVMIVQAADHVDLDPSCVLYGAIELTPLDTVSLGPLDVPRVVLTLGVVMLVNATFIMVFYKELKISSFDPALATASGVHAGLMHYLLMILVAVTAVASFESVGNVLVVAMFVVPPAAAYMLTDRLARMIVVSVILAALSAILGHVGAIALPAWFGFQSTSTAGMMAVAAGVMLGLAILFSPRHGVLVKLIRQRKLAWRILADDVVALLYRFDEREEHSQATPVSLADALLIDRFTLGLTIRWLRLSGSVLWRTEASGGWCELTARGRERARELVRSHRLWEQYLISQAGVESERIHDKAERYEHFTDVAMRDLLDAETNAPRIDPHGSPIPREHESR